MSVTRPLGLPGSEGPHLRLVVDDSAPSRDLEVMADAAAPRGQGWNTAIVQATERLQAAAGRTDALLAELAASAATLLDAPATVALLEGGFLVQRAATGGLGQLAGQRVPTQGTVCGAALSGRRPVRIGESLDPATSACCPAALSHLAVPMVDGERLLGVLALTSPHPRWFDDADVAGVGVLAAVTARGLAGLAPTLPSSTAAAPGLDGGSLAAGSGLGLWEWDVISGKTTWSDSVGELLGIRAGDRITLPYLRSLVHADDRARFDAALAAQLSGAAGLSFTCRVAPPGRPGRQVNVWAEMRRVGNRIVGAWGAVAEAGGRDLQVAALRSSVAGLRAAAESTGLAVWEWHPHDGRLEWSHDMYRIAGLEPGSVRPSLPLWHSLIHPDDLPRAQRLDALAAGEGGGTVESFRVQGVDGVTRHVQSWSTLLPGDADLPGAIAGAAVDITRQVADRVQLEQRSTTDPVTGLANRHGFDRHVTDLLADRSRDVALVLLDLDRFKLVNDSLGHQVGDRLLVEVARRLQRVVPLGSVTARMGGDEFVIVPPPGLSGRELGQLARAVLDDLRAPVQLSSGEVLVCPASIGVTSTDGRDVDIDELLSEADLALYRAKDTGRDRYVVFDDALRDRAQSRHRAEQQLRLALEEGRLTLEYQPIVDLSTGDIVGAEALVRMLDERGGIVGPDAFIEVAEDTGVIVELDCWVIEAALNQVVEWERCSASPTKERPWLAVNVSPRSVEHPRVVRSLLDGLALSTLPPTRLKVELTERSFLSSTPGAETALRSLIEAGVPVGIDDFGTGYSALAYLPRFALDFMKIDRSFVVTVGQDDRADAVVTAIVALAHAHGMKVTAEGVETAQQAQRLQEIGCDYAQGLYFGGAGDPDRIVPG